MANSATQDDAVVNAKADAAANTSGSVGPGSHASKAVVFVSGTAKVVDTLKDCFLYLNITTAAALKIEMGPTSAAAIQISTSQSSALGVVSLYVPAGYYVKLTGTMANLTNVAVQV